jgi:hypothetical protein
MIQAQDAYLTAIMPKASGFDSINGFAGSFSAKSRKQLVSYTNSSKTKIKKKTHLQV